MVDGLTGERLDSRGQGQSMPIGGAAKLMTAYVALKDLPLSRMVRATPYPARPGEPVLGLRPGQRVSVRDLLYGLILRGDDDAAVDLAVAAAGSEAAFVRQMNRDAAALRLAHTHYADATGLSLHGDRSSAVDLASLTRSLLRMPAFAQIASARHAVLRSLHPPRRIAIDKALLAVAPWATAVNVSPTSGAQFVVVAPARQAGTELVAAMIGAESQRGRFKETRQLIEYVLSFYYKRVPVRAGQAMAEPSIRYSGGTLPLEATRTVKAGVRSQEGLHVSVDAPQQVEGPIEKGAVLGHAVVRVHGIEVASVPLEAAENVAKASAWERGRSFVGANVGWIALVLAALLGAAVLLRRRRSRRAAEREGSPPARRFPPSSSGPVLSS